MAAIQFTDRRSVESLALARAASAAMSAPATVDGRPWRWRIDGPLLSLFAEDTLGAVTVSCGIVLHHARIALAADGVAADVRYLPDPARSDLLATIGHTGPARPGTAEVRLYRAIAARHSDTRPISAAPVPEAVLDRVLAAARRPGVTVRTRDARLSVHPTDDRPELLLGAGEATSAILLAANVEGLATELGPGPGGAVATVRIGVPAAGPRIR
ncbi:hypothetical protein [Virgisporangium aurantiacum]|uniref:Uncharacterized protein n=1 Tax=Virgisporangium aurantiacum TaxID=175570 RepID=A0A8J3YZR7_9ACTN|nr:hypothetical protein [Virgisporangium aurantiacum]GIJ54736.1 hypothetical protein Vau01_022520 [Virgisporangium aurantiacum]